MRIFLDCEFMETGYRDPIQLISIGLVAEDGREFYAVNSEFEWQLSNMWLLQNVLPHLAKVDAGGRCLSLRPPDIAKEIVEFVHGTKDKPRFIGYYCDTR